MAIAFVQHASTTAQYTSGSSATTSATFASNTTAGNCLVACWTLEVLASGSSGPVFSSINTNGAVENWSGQGYGADPQVGIDVNPNTGGGQKIINLNWSFGGTATTSNSCCALVDIYEFSGLVLSGVTDQVTGFSNSNIAWDSGATSTTTLANELWIGNVGIWIATFNTTSTVTPPGAFTNQTLLQSSAQLGGTGTSSRLFVYQQSGYQIVSSTGTAEYNGTASQQSSSTWAANVFTLKAAGSFVNTPSIQNLRQAVNRACRF